MVKGSETIEHGKLENSEDVLRLIKERLPMLKVLNEMGQPGIDSSTVIVELPNGGQYHITCEEMDEEE